MVAPLYHTNDLMELPNIAAYAPACPPLWTHPPMLVGTWLELPMRSFCIGPAQAIFVPLYCGPPENATYEEAPPRPKPAPRPPSENAKAWAKDVHARMQAMAKHQQTHCQD